MLNKLVLGTVQFGLDYGVNNNNGKPSLEKIYLILDETIKKGISFLDTAPAYGNSEEIIGGYIKNRGLKGKIKIVSKFTGLNNSKNIYDFIKKNINNSLNILGIDYLDGYLLHNAKDFYNIEIIHSIIDIKKEGLIKNIGVSIYEIEDAINVSKDKFIDYIQIPFNILDQRLNNTDFFTNCKKNGIKIFARSPFLQGLILMNEDKIPSNLFGVIPYLNKFDKIISKYGLTRAEACIYYVLQNKKIDYFLFGVDNIEQLNQNIDIVNKNIDFSEGIKEIENEFIKIEKILISPNLWNK